MTLTIILIIAVVVAALWFIFEFVDWLYGKKDNPKDIIKYKYPKK